MQRIHTNIMRITISTLVTINIITTTNGLIIQISKNRQACSATVTLAIKTAVMIQVTLAKKRMMRTQLTGKPFGARLLECLVFHFF